jgi:long-chain acyl-CoA synthetase
MTTWKSIPKVEEPWLKFYPKESPRHIEYEEIPVDSILKRSLKEFSNSIAIAFEGKYLTYAELDNLVDRFATGLSKLGIKEKDVVAIDMPNIPQYVIAFFAVARLGAVVNPIVALNRYAEIVHQCNDSKAKMLIMFDFLFEEHMHGKPLNKMTTVQTIMLTSLGEYLPGIKRVLGTALNKFPRMKVWPSEPIDNIKFLKFQDVLASGASISIPAVKINPMKDTVCLIYTGGTTGAPKGVEQTHFNLIANCFQAHTWVSTQVPKFIELRGKGGMVCVLPLSHSFGLTLGMLIGLWFGLKLILVPAPPPKISDLLKDIVKEDAIFCPGVPTLWNKINQDPDSVKYKEGLKSGNFLACMSGAAPLPAEVKKKFEELTGSIIIEGYGMSEASPVLSGNPFSRSRPGVGLPMADTYLKIVDAAEGNTIYPICPHSNEYCLEKCGPEEVKYIGEICGSGPQIMKGYLNRAEETTKVLRKDKDGVTWYYTSDIGCIDAEGYMHIKDRKRDMIKRSGHAVFPREVEDLMYTYDPILEVAVYGIPNAETGEEVKAVVSLKPDFVGKVTEKDVIEWCKANIAPYKYPRIVNIVKEIPKSPVGKVLRRVLRDEDLAKK